MTLGNSCCIRSFSSDSSLNVGVRRSTRATSSLEHVMPTIRSGCAPHTYILHIRFTKNMETFGYHRQSRRPPPSLRDRPRHLNKSDTGDLDVCGRDSVGQSRRRAALRLLTCLRFIIGEPDDWDRYSLRGKEPHTINGRAMRETRAACYGFGPGVFIASQPDVYVSRGASSGKFPPSRPIERPPAKRVPIVRHGEARLQQPRK